MIEPEDGHPSWSTPLTFRLDAKLRSSDVVRRCGDRVPAGRPFLEAEPSSARLQPIFTAVPFCSIPCLRAFVRETIESFDGHSDPPRQEICSDLRELVLDLEEVWSSLEAAYPFRPSAS